MGRWFVCCLVSWWAVFCAGAAEFDLVVRGGTVVDGSGGKQFVADVGISEGVIARVGKIGEGEGKRELDAAGLVVAPGFIDMMGQTATPMLDDPKTAFNLLTQGITTINAGEGASAAPAQGRGAGKERWQTMAEYLQILDLRGMPLNVVQTVGHTQVRREVMGDEDREPTGEEMARMKDLVDEAMRAGAIGVSTALIYPPAVYADTEEIAGLAAVAGRYGGRYFTHMRNEGDRLLEAIDEALEIGKKGGVPVHIFHLKAAGRGNWAKMDEAVAKIVAARNAGEEVAADIYPYVNNGLGIGAMIHPRHYADGHAALMGRLEDAALRDEIRQEMESGEGDWENWYKHVGNDWGKVVLGRANGLRFRSQEGKSVAEVAAAFGADVWETFFELVRVQAFVMPESMSEANKERLVGEPFISFCTDVGPAGGGRWTSHPRAWGAFPRVLAEYVKKRGATTLEKAVRQATAVAAAEVMASDRGTIVAGKAADVIVFDYENLTDRATLADADAPAEGMRYVIVNGQVVLEDGKQTERRPGRVLRGPGWRGSEIATSGERVEAFDGVETMLVDFMKQHRIPGASLAISDGKKVVYSRGFGMADLAEEEPVTRGSRFRVASLSKPITAVAVMRLVEAGKLGLDDRVFELLDVEPLEGAEVDERLGEITVRHLLQHRGGWDRGESFDAMFRSVDFAEAEGSDAPAGPWTVMRNMMGQRLDFTPGERYAYSNYGYCLLGRVIEKVSGKGYEDFVRTDVLAPVGAGGMRIGKTRIEGRLEDEVRYYSPYLGASVFKESLGERVPYPYGGWHLEAMDSHGAWVATAEEMVKFADGAGSGDLLGEESVAAMFERPPGAAGYGRGGEEKTRYYSLGWGNRMEDEGVVSSHSGSLAGTATLVVKRPDGRSWALFFNARNGYGVSHFATALGRAMDDEISKVPKP